MAVNDVAQGLVSLCREGKFMEAVETYYGPEIVSVEAGGPQPEVRGLDAVRAKGQWWVESFEVHSIDISDPRPNGDQFAVVIKMDATEKASGKRFLMEEVAVYTVADDKIVHERFFYSM